MALSRRKKFTIHILLVFKTFKFNGFIFTINNTNTDITFRIYFPFTGSYSFSLFDIWQYFSPLRDTDLMGRVFDGQVTSCEIAPREQ